MEYGRDIIDACEGVELKQIQVKWHDALTG